MTLNVVNCMHSNILLHHIIVQFSPLTNCVVGGWGGGGRGTIQQRSYPLQSFLQEALVSSSDMGRHVHSLILSILC